MSVNSVVKRFEYRIKHYMNDNFPFFLTFYLFASSYNVHVFWQALKNLNLHCKARLQSALKLDNI